MTIKKVGFVGIGNMGAPMASHLIRAGFDVTVYDVRSETVSIFVERHGGKGAESLDELARNVEAVITMLPNDKIVREVVLGANGVVGGYAKAAWSSTWARRTRSPHVRYRKR